MYVFSYLNFFYSKCWLSVWQSFSIHDGEVQYACQFVKTQVKQLDKNNEMILKNTETEFTLFIFNNPASGSTYIAIVPNLRLIIGWQIFYNNFELQAYYDAASFFNIRVDD